MKEQDLTTEIQERTNTKITERVKILFAFILTASLLFLPGCSFNKTKEESIFETTLEQSLHNHILDSTSQQKYGLIPEDFTYKIVRKNIVPNIKRSLTVRINKKISKEALRTIAMKLKLLDKRQYKRTFIAYYLPDMEIGTTAWATTHFEPDLRIIIYRATIEQEKFLKQISEDISGKIIGIWFDESPGGGLRITIYSKDGKLFMRNTFHDGSYYEKELVKRESPLGQGFEKIDESTDKYTADDHFVIDSNGNLQIRDKRGLIATAKKIKSNL